MTKLSAERASSTESSCNFVSLRAFVVKAEATLPQADPTWPGTTWPLRCALSNHYSH